MLEQLTMHLNDMTLKFWIGQLKAIFILMLREMIKYAIKNKWVLELEIYNILQDSRIADYLVNIDGMVF